MASPSLTLQKLVQHSGLHDSLKRIFNIISRDKPRDPLAVVSRELRGKECLEAHKNVCATKLQSLFRARRVRLGRDKKNAAMVALDKLLRGKYVKLTADDRTKMSVIARKINHIYKGRVKRRAIDERVALEKGERDLKQLISPDKFDELVEKSFTDADAENSGMLDYREFRDCFLRVCKAIGVKFTAEQISQVMKSADADGDGDIAYPEFKAVAWTKVTKVLAKTILEEPISEKAMLRAHQMVSNRITKEELVAKLYKHFQSAQIDDSGALPKELFRNVVLHAHAGFHDCIKELDDFFVTAEYNEKNYVIFAPFIEQFAWNILISGVANQLKYELLEKVELRKEAEEMLKFSLRKDELELTLLRSFKQADRDGSNALSQKEFIRHMLKTHLGFTRREVVGMFREIDIDASKRLNLEEFTGITFDLLVQFTMKELFRERQLIKDAKENTIGEILIKGKKRNDFESNIRTLLGNNVTMKKEDFIDCLRNSDLQFSDDEIEMLIDNCNVESDENPSLRVMQLLKTGTFYDVMRKFELKRIAQENIQREKRFALAEKQLLQGMTKKELLMKLQEQFESADEDGSGTLTNGEFVECLMASNLGLSKERIQKMCSDFDKDSDGFISFTEFIPLAFKILVKTTVEHMMNEEEEDEKLQIAEAVEDAGNEMEREEDEEREGGMVEVVEEEEENIGLVEEEKKEFAYDAEVVVEQNEGEKDEDPLEEETQKDEGIPEEETPKDITPKEGKDEGTPEEETPKDDTAKEGIKKEDKETHHKVRKFLVEAFKNADVDNSGTLNIKEFERCILDADEKAQWGPKDKSTGKRYAHTGIEKSDVRKIREKLDSNHDGMFEFDEVIDNLHTLIEEILKEKQEKHEKELKEAEAFLQFEGSSSSSSSDDEESK
eukprot:g5024.t1